MANIQPTVDALDEPTVMLQIRKIAGTVDSNLEAVNNEMANIQEQIDQMEDTSARVTALENEMDTVQSDLTAVENKNTEQDSAISENENALQSEIVARQNADITASELLYSEGVLTLKLTRQSGDIQETVDVPFFKTVTLIPTSTERAFKLQFTMWDDSVYDTNEFVIPAGGGTDVSVTGVTIGEGASDNSFKVSIQLSDASTIASNDYPFPTATTSPYPTDVMLSLSGNTLTCDIALSDSNYVDGSVDLTNLLSIYATTEDLSDLQEQVTGLKLSTDGNNMTLNGDSVQIVKTVTGSVSGNNLTIGVNGVNSSPIELPSTQTEKTEFVYLNRGSSGEFALRLDNIDDADDTSPKQYYTCNAISISGGSCITVGNIVINPTHASNSTSQAIMLSVLAGDTFNALKMVIPDKYYPITFNGMDLRVYGGTYYNFETSTPYPYVKIKNIGIYSESPDTASVADNTYLCDCIINMTNNRMKVNKKIYSINSDALKFMISPLSVAEIYTSEPTFD